MINLVFKSERKFGVKKFQNLSAERQKKIKPQLQRDYSRVASKMKSLKIDVPKLSAILKDTNSWSETVATTRSDRPVKTVQQLIEDAYLRTLSRFPDAEETEISLAFIEESKTPADGVQSLLWALVNTKEFIITH